MLKYIQICMKFAFAILNDSHKYNLNWEYNYD